MSKRDQKNKNIKADSIDNKVERKNPIKIVPSNWLYNAGVMGFLSCLDREDYLVKGFLEERYSFQQNDIINLNRKVFKEINIDENYFENGRVVNLRGKNNYYPNFLAASPDNIITEILTKAQNQRVLVVLNTIKQAKDIYERTIKALENGNSSLKKDNVILFHSEMTLNEKKDKKDNIEKLFKNPKSEDENEGKLLIATQVVEAALDLDADILYTEIAPMDALVQRMGRVLRRYNGNFTLKEKCEPNVFVLVFENGYESGNGKVYDKELIEKTIILFDKFDSLEIIDSNKEKILKEYYKKNKFKIEEVRLFEKIEGKKSKNRKNFDIEEKTFTTVSLSEYEKYELVEKLYSILNQDGKYLSDFYTMLDILDAGFMSDRKEEAQRMFREITNIQVIEDTKKEEFIKAIKEFAKKEINYTLFKKEIIAKLVISIPYYRFEKIKKEKATEWINLNDINNDEYKYNKINKWLNDIYIIKSFKREEYEKYDGINKKEQKKMLENQI